MFSRRASRDPSPNALALLHAKIGAPRYDLTGTNPTRAGIDYPVPEQVQRLLERAQSASLVYRPEPLGARTAREAVSRVLTQGAAAAEDILLTASTSEAYGFLFKLLCDPGDAVLIPAPSYPLFEHLAELEGIRALPYRLAYDGAWHVDLDSVRRALTPGVRAIVVVSPNNPTGQYLAPAEFSALAELGLPLIVDEVFFEYGLADGATVPPRASQLAEAGQTLVFSLDGLSKLAGLPQLKLGWTLISGPAALRSAARERLELIADAFLSVATPVQQALPELLVACPARTAAIGARCRQSLALLERGLGGTPLTLLRAQAGWSAVLRLPRVASEEELVLGLLEHQQVLVQPGWFYDFESEPYVVVSLLTEPAVLEAGVRELVDYVTRLSA